MKRTYSFKSRVYHWMCMNLPFRLMHKRIWIDSQHKIWIPRYGYSKIQQEEVDKSVNELIGNMKFE
jgi:hypothetical protein